MATKRKIALWVLTIFVVVGSFFASQWQFDRHNERSERAKVINSALNQSILQGVTPNDSVEFWSPVRFEGVISQESILIRKRPLEGRNGFWVINSFQTLTGFRIALLVGWIPSTAPANAVVEIPNLSTELVTINGVARPFEEAVFATDLPNNQKLSLDRNSVKSDYDFFVHLTSSSKSLSQEIKNVPIPGISHGPHLFYAIQWLLFALIAIVGSVWLTKTESLNVKSKSP
jgi:cytochrome oxidase assembly protein ShyY1